MYIRNEKDFWSGVIFVGFGIFFGVFGFQYGIGTTASMGPGYFPVLVSAILFLLGLFVIRGSLAPNSTIEKIEKFSWRTLVLVLGSVVSFGVLLEPLGLVVALLSVIVLSSYASHEFTWKAALGNAAVLISMCVAIFVWGLKLQVHTWPTIFSH